MFTSTTDSPANTNWQTPPDGTVTRVWDAITDFTQGTDKIDLSAYMGATDLGWANGVPTGNAVWYVNSGTSTFIYVDVDNNPPPDVMIELQNRGTLTLTANDFIGVVGGATGTGAAPVFTSPAAYTVPENGTAVGTVAATDADSPTVTYSLVAGGDAARFAINTTTGALSFVAAPNFEAPTDVGANNVYNLTVQASDGTLNTTQAIAVTVTNVNDVAPAFTSPAAYSIPENGTAVGTVTATDADSPTVTYSLVAGGDAASFTINATTGALSFVTAPNFEAPTDAGTNNVYNLTVQASDGTLNTTQALAVTVTDVVNEGGAAPVFTSPAAYSIPENSTAVGTVAATDADSPTVTYSLVAGGDAARFAINTTTGALSFVAAPNFEAPTDVGVNNVYNLTVQASDGTLNTTQAIAVTVTNVNDVAPAFTSPAAYSIPENGTAVGTVTATDADSPAVTYSLVAGGDAASFTINATTGALSFVAAPNFEAPTDVGANNVYNLTVQASDGSLNTTQAIAVTVTDVLVEPIAGTAGNDTLTGTAGDDIFDIGAGGNDTVTAGTGNDTVLAGAAFNALDRIDGGTEPSDAVETDVLVLNGNYAAGVTFAATTLVNVEEIQLAAGNSYSLTTHDATVVASTMAIDGSALGAGNTLTVNAAAETEAGSSYSMYGGAGTDSLTGGAGDDYFDISFGGNDTVNGGAGRDTIYAGAALTAADQINGGAGTDFVYLSGNYSAGLTFGATTLTGIEAIVAQPGNSYNLTMNNAMLTGTQAATVDGFSLASGNTLTVNASAETDAGTVYTLSGGAGNDNLTGGAGNDQINGNAGNDILVGGAGNDILTGGAGNDILTGGLGNDVFDFNTLTDRGTTGDTITDFSKAGANGVDVLNLHDLLTTFTGFNGTNAFSGGYLQFDTSSGTSTTVRVDSTGGANSFVTLVTTNGTLLLQTDTANYVL